MALSSKQELAALEIALGKKHKEVAAELSVVPATISNWMNNPEFQVSINRNRKEILDNSQQKIVSLSGKAVDTLDKLLDSESDHVRLQASRAILEANGLTGGEKNLQLRYGLGIGKTTLD